MGQLHLHIKMLPQVPMMVLLLVVLLLLLLLPQHHLTLLLMMDQNGNGIPVNLLLIAQVKVQAPNAALSRMIIIIIRSLLKLPFVLMLMQLWFH
jgi:hypothetical protein